jgi:hypothetical protein
MARQTTASLLARAVRMNGGTKCKDQPDDTLREFAKFAVALRNVFYQDRPLDKAEFLFMEFHMQALEIAYLRWKRKHTLPTDFH